MADSFPEFDDSEIDGAGLKTKDAMRIFLATTPDNSTSKWRRSSPK